MIRRALKRLLFIASLFSWRKGWPQAEKFSGQQVTQIRTLVRVYRMKSNYEHPNYQFLVGKASGKVLDFGCGKGDMVLRAIEAGLDAHGVEYFGPGSGIKIKSVLEERGLLGNSVLEYDGVTLPFADNTFDTVISNQVLEHVPNVGQALSEISRVLKHGGRFVCSFPYQDAFREGHSNTLFAHWFPKGRSRYAILLVHRFLGVGRLKGNRGISGWAHFFNDWLEKNTFYLTGRRVQQLFSLNFKEFKHIEPEYMRFRYGRVPMPGFVCRRFGSLVIEATK
jgi:SAM-dependent methyltransferase